MIKANELRIGNLIIYKEYGEGDGVIGQIKAGDIGRVRFHDDEYIPIPLTPEWLERCGLLLNEYDYYSIGEQFALRKNVLQNDKGVVEGYILMGKGYYGLVAQPIIKHVHQLQNLYFALTGEELTIKVPAEPK